jgi:uric acid transporter
MAQDKVVVTVQPATRPADQVLPIGRLLVYGLQHTLAMYASAVAVPVIVGLALSLSHEQLVYLINANLLVCGIATLVQTLGLGKLRIGIKLPIMQGCAFAAVAPMILIGNSRGLTSIYGSMLIAGLVTILLSPFYSRLLRLFAPVVNGTVIALVAISFLPIATSWIGNDAASAPVPYVLLALAVLLLLFCIYHFCTGFIRTLAVGLALLAGTLVALAMGIANFSGVASANWLGVTLPFHYGWPAFHTSAIISMTLVMLVMMTETTGSIIAVSEVVEEPLTPRALASGLAASGLVAVIGGIFNAFPSAVAAQSIGLVSLSNVRSRFVVAIAGGMLVVLSLFPKLAALVASIPLPVLGGAGLALFGVLIASGIRTLTQVNFVGNHIINYNYLIFAISVAVGLVPILAPDFYAMFPAWSQIILDSGITTGTITAIVLNLLFNGARPARSPRVTAPIADRIDDPPLVPVQIDR